MKKAKCLRCGYEWETTSTLVMVTCPSCQLKVKVKDVKKKVEPKHLNS